MTEKEEKNVKEKEGKLEREGDLVEIPNTVSGGNRILAEDAFFLSSSSRRRMS